MTEIPTDFEFDFHVDRGRASSGSGPPGRETGRRERELEHSNGNPGASDGDLDASAAPSERAPADVGGPGRARGVLSALRGEPADGSGNGRLGAAPAPENGGSGSQRRGRRTTAAPDERPGRPRRGPAREDWLSLTDAELIEADLEQLASGDGASRPPGEGRMLARAARRRASKRARAVDEESSFEALLERQAQRTGALRRGTALLEGARGLLDGGRERLRGLREPQPGGRDRDGAPPRLPKISSRRPRRPKPGRVKRVRLAVIFAGLGLLAMVSTVFGMMMAVAQDLPALENKEQYAASQNTEVFDVRGRKIGTLLSNSRRILVDSEDISPYIKNAVVAVEDERFYEHRGVDFEGIGRALLSDVVTRSFSQGASTITQQFVKNALEAQGSRTVFQKLRESALAYHLERQWDKDKILTQYLNTIYFGEGAYGVEAAARTYFGYRYPGCGSGDADPCSSELAPEEAALMAGIISSPAAYSPRANPPAALERRNEVLGKMKDQGVLSEEEFENSSRQSLPPASEIQKPNEDSLAPYFTSWLRQQVVDLYGAGRAFGGGLDVQTTVDLDLQREVEEIAYGTLAGIEPTASVVVIDNETGGIKAMLGGNDFEKEPFNLAINGHRQPGSAFKPFILATALTNGRSSSEVLASQPKEFPVPGVSPKEEVFEVHNYEDNYLGSASIATALTYSDNSVFAELGLQVGTRKIAETAEQMGIETNISTNPAMTLGGLERGLTPLEMAHAFSTFAAGGERVSGTLDTIAGEDPGTPRDDGPVAITKIESPDGGVLAENKTVKERVLSEGVADEAVSLMESVVDTGTGTAAQTGDFAWGKTGTTENNGDAWFCGGSEDVTACVWVGYPNATTPMETEFNGGPVDGGTFPALIWSSVMQAWASIKATRGETDDDDADGDADVSSSYSTGSSGSSDSSSGGGGGGGDGSGGGGGSNQQAAPAPAAPPPASSPPSAGGGTPAGGGSGL